MKIPGLRRSSVQQRRLCFCWKRLPVTKGSWCFLVFLVSKAPAIFWCIFFCCERFWLYILFGCKRFDSCVLESLFVVQVPGVKNCLVQKARIWCEGFMIKKPHQDENFASGIVYVFLFCFIFFHFLFLRFLPMELLWRKLRKLQRKLWKLQNRRRDIPKSP